MALFLEIVGGIVVAGLVLAVIAFFYIRSKLRQLVKGIQDFGRPVRRIHLEPRSAPAWQDDAEARKLTDPLLARGFVDAGHFAIAEMPSIAMQALVHPGESIWGSIYQKEDTGTWLDLVIAFEDGEGWTWTTHKSRGLDDRPGHPKIRQEEQDSAKLFDRLLAEAPRDRARRPVTVDGFTARFEKSYADEMDWRAAHGVSKEEIRAIADSGANAGASDEAIDLTSVVSRAQHLRNLDESLRERFAEQAKIPVKKWASMQKRVLVVHDKLELEWLMDPFKKIVAKTQLEIDFPESSMPSRVGFVKVNEQLPEGHRFEKLGELAEPIAADVWCAPER